MLAIIRLTLRLSRSGMTTAQRLGRSAGTGGLTSHGFTFSMFAYHPASFSQIQKANTDVAVDPGQSPRRVAAVHLQRSHSGFPRILYHHASQHVALCLHPPEARCLDIHAILFVSLAPSDPDFSVTDM